MLTEAEVRERLKKKDYEHADIDDAVEMLLEYKYLNDEELSKMVAREAARVKRGPLWVRQTLLRRRVKEVWAEQAAETLRIQEKELAGAFLHHRFGCPEDLDDKERARAFRQLAGRGFSWDCVRDLLGNEGH